MMTQVLLVLAAVSVLLGFSGLVYGVTASVERSGRRLLGLRLLQGGMTVGGLLMLALVLAGGESSYAAFGLLLLAFGTGVTAILPPKSR